MDLRNKEYFAELEVDRIFDYYDMPRVFTCMDSDGKTFLAVNVGEDSISCTWIYMFVSESRLSQLYSRKFDLREAILSAEDGFVFLVISSYRSQNQVTKIVPLLLSKENIPNHGRFLENKIEAPRSWWRRFVDWLTITKFPKKGKF